VLVHYKRKQGLPSWAAVAATLVVSVSLLAVVQSVYAKPQQEEAVPLSESAAAANFLPPGAMAELEQANPINEQIEKPTFTASQHQSGFNSLDLDAGKAGDIRQDTFCR
jgi:hypothetical protein